MSILLRLLSALFLFVAFSPLALAETPMVFDPGRDELWVVDPWGGRVSVLSTLSGAWLEDVQVPGDPRSLALTRDGSRLFVAVPSREQVVVIDTARRRIHARFSVRGGPWNLALSPNGTRLVLTLRERPSVVFLEPGTGRVTSRIEGPFFNTPHAVAITDDGDPDDLDEVVLVAEFSARGSQIELEPGQATHVLPHLHRLALDVERHLSSVPIAIDPDSHTGGLPTNLRQLVLSPDGAEVFLIGEQANTARGRRIGGTGGNTPHPEDDRAFVRSDGRFNGPGVSAGTPPVNPVLMRFSAATGRERGARVVIADDRPLIGRTPVGGSRALAFSPTGEHLYVANAASMDVTVLDARTLAEVGVFDVGHFPSGLTFDAEGRLHVLAAYEFAVHAFDVSQPDRPVRLHVIPHVSSPSLPPEVLHGLRLFSSGRNERVLPASRKVSGVPQMSCQSCHPDGRTNGLVWDQTELGKGPRATQELIEWDQSARLGWDGFRDEMQDFVNAAARFESGAHLESFDPTLPDQTNDPSFGRVSNAGVDRDLDATAHALDVLFARTSNGRSPYRAEDGRLSAEAQRGFDVFADAGCTLCHPPSRGFSDSGVFYDGINFMAPLDPGSNPDTLKWDVGTIGPLDASSPAAVLNLNTDELAGFDTPVLRHAYRRSTFFHDGRALSLEEVIGSLGDQEHLEHAGSGFLGAVGSSQRADDLLAFLLSVDDATFTWAEESGPETLGSQWTYGLHSRPGLIPMVYAARGSGEITVPSIGTLLLEAASLVLIVDGLSSGLRVPPSGDLELPFRIPLSPELIGLELHVQTAMFDGSADHPAGISNRVVLHVRP